MSIYHRYALLYNLQRYLADIDRLGDLVSQCDIVDDSTKNGVSIALDLPAIKNACKDPDRNPQPAPLGDDGQNENAEEQGSRASQNDQCGDEDKENHKPHDDHKSLEDNKDHNVPDAQLDGQDKPGCERDIKFDEAHEAHEAHSPDIATTELDTDRACPGDGTRFKITRSQLNRVLDCDRTLNRLNAGLVKNIHRIEEEENELSSQTIQHFWREAARLNGTEKIKSLRVMERETASSGWWEDEPSGGGNSVLALGNTNNVAGSEVGTALRPPSSPLQNPIKSDDLLWDDQVQQWRLDMGRLMDDQGRRYVKI